MDYSPFDICLSSSKSPDQVCFAELVLKIRRRCRLESKFIRRRLEQGTPLEKMSTGSGKAAGEDDTWSSKRRWRRLRLELGALPEKTTSIGAR
ncbi:unnamed protein product [Linum trigynum]|uniref:Uncharacterized protein n=1 Tax=Linum trigynum TaxID=586398 RepID=A0AAV2D823_9ROSI